MHLIRICKNTNNNCLQLVKSFFTMLDSGCDHIVCNQLKIYRLKKQYDMLYKLNFYLKQIVTTGTLLTNNIW